MKITDFGACEEAGLKYYLGSNLPEGHRARREYEEVMDALTECVDILHRINVDGCWTDEIQRFSVVLKLAGRW